MNTSRRDFLKQGAALAATLSFSSSLLAKDTGTRLTGMQLYCVRDQMKADPMGTLKKLAAIGYKYVEHANYVDRKFYGWKATEFKKILDDLGMKMPSGHTVMGKQHWDAGKKEFTDLWKYTVEDAATVGQQFVISPSLDESLRKTRDDCLRYMEVFNKAGELCRKSGMKFGYHNHDFEFSQKLDGQVLYDIILKNTDPSLVMQQLDTGNLYNGGAKAIDIMRQYPGRFESMHVKDEILTKDGHEKYESTILGKGIVNVKEVIDLGKKNGTLHFIIEQEAYQGKDPVDCMKENFAVMKSWGY
ncbi:MAG: TIM barrel protein [Bacteroidetes bacterium]|nr:TIM barrel protein [Bacteroidota bacterium]MBS1975903.1 TIM barrel protein [Bacteroidota bacterium]